MEKYFIALDKMSIDEIEIIRLLSRYSNYDTNVAGYTVNQLVVNAAKRLNLTTQKVRTILKKLEKEGYIKFLSAGSKGKESTLKLTLKDKLFNQQQSNNNLTNKSEQFQEVEDLPNNNVTTNQQHYKDKKNNNNILIDSYTQNDDLKTTINDFISMRNKIKKPVTQRALKGILNKLDSFTNNDFEKILILENSIENCWLSVYELKNKKASTKVDTGKKNNNSVNPNICSSRRKYSQACDIG